MITPPDFIYYYKNMIKKNSTISCLQLVHIARWPPNTLISSIFFLFLYFGPISSSSSIRHEAEYPEELVIRKISSGLVRGRPIPLDPSSAAFIFAAIPYARAPIGPLRFRRPQASETWEGIRDSRSKGPACWWNTLFVSPADDAAHPKDEHCLLVNVFSSARCLARGGCAVFHYIHGGQFMFGTARKLDDRIIAQNFCSPGRDVIVVTFDYRMNVFGLLNLNYRLPPKLNSPNLAIHDIVASLEWTRREIAAFGGDPDRVTLGGQSSGSVATQILMLCPRANHLFHQTISMSGPGTIEMLPKNRNQRASRQLALELGCVSSAEFVPEFWSHPANVSRVLRCLRALPARALSDAARRMERLGLFFHGLAMETGEGAIITDTFPNLINQYNNASGTRKHRVMTGTVSKEFLDSAVVVDPYTGTVNTLRLELYCTRMVRQLNYAQGDTPRTRAECVREYGDSAWHASSLFDDVNYYVPHLLFARNMALHRVPMFLYQFEYDRIGNASRTALPPALAPRHVQDLVYLLGENKGTFTARDRRLQYLHSALFVNFVANGTLNDGVEIRNARPFDPTRDNFYRIDFAQDNEDKLIGDTPEYHTQAVLFWAELMPRKFGKPRFLSDEALIDDQMLSVYLPGDLANVGQFLHSKQARSGKRIGFWHSLFLAIMMSLLLVLILLGLLWLLWRLNGRRKGQYRPIDGN